MGLEIYHLLTVPWKLCLMWLGVFRLLVLLLSIRQLHFFIVVQGWLCRHVGFERLGCVPVSVYPCPLFPCRVLGCAQPVLPGSAFFRSFRFKSGTLYGGDARVYHLTSPLFPSPCPESPQFPVDVFGHCGRPSIFRCHSYSLANPRHSLGNRRLGMCCKNFGWHPISSRDSARGTLRHCRGV
jgi:hypothetical protein